MKDLVKVERPKGWCRDYRLEIMNDLLVEKTDAYTLVECVDGIHKGCWIAWLPDGECFAVGPEVFVRRKLQTLSGLVAK